MQHKLVLSLLNLYRYDKSWLGVILAGFLRNRKCVRNIPITQKALRAGSFFMMIERKILCQAFFENVPKNFKY